MDKKEIVIVTGTGGHLGTGHIQRMLNLVSFMNEKHDFDIRILTMSGNYAIPAEFTGIKISAVPGKADLIIRDMRDSSKEEMLSFGKTAPVLALDDAGTGRNSAKYALDLLPLPSSEASRVSPDTGRFLYGYNFVKGIESLPERRTDGRDIDIAIYAGFTPPSALLSQIAKSIPQNSHAILLSSGKPVVLTGKPLPGDISYSEILTRSRIVMTHFGITMFEAHACGCMIAALNPTPYHCRLTSLVEKDMKIIHSIEYSNFDPVIMSDDLSDNLKKNIDLEISVNDILSRIYSGRENFTRYIYKILM